MESATLTRPSTGPAWLAPLIAVPAAAWARLCLLAGTLVAAVGFLVFPTYPIYDSYYYLLWGRELTHLQALSFHVYRAPTEHPLAIAFGALLSLVGEHADRLLIAATIVSFLALAAGIYRLSRLAFAPLVGAVAVILLGTRLSLSFLAIRGYIDIPYLAVIAWAAALEAERPRRGTPVFWLLLAAELMRPESWLLGGLYFLWCARGASSRTQLAGWAAMVAAGPVIWTSIDAAVTGDPLFSLHSTSGLAASFGRNKGISAVPGAMWQYLDRLDHLPVLLGAIAGLVLALLLVPRHAWMPLVLAVSGLGTFVVIGAAGLSLVDRYVLVPSLMAIVFCAFALSGWTMLVPGSAMRRLWAAGAAALTAFGVITSANSLSIATIRTELGFRGDYHSALVAILREPRVRAGLACGPLSVPNHKLVPEARWLLGRGPDGVIARSDARTQAAKGHLALSERLRHGVALYPTGLAVQRQALVDQTDNPLDQVPLPGYVRVATTQYYGAYARC